METKVSNIPCLNLSDYDNRDIPLGHGSYGNVFLVMNKITKKNYALKRIVIHKNEKLHVEREIEVMSSLQNPCLCQLLGYHHDQDSNFLYILLPYYQNGSLDFLIKRKNAKCAENKNFNITLKMKALYGIALGMAYMHSERAIHRDLKPANVLLDEKNEVKIIDFGTSRFFNLMEPLTSLNVGTPIYMAPEIIKEEPYDQKVDVYSYGITIYEILYEKPAYTCTNSFRLFNMVTGGKRPEMDKSTFQYGEGLFNLIQKCWSPSPMVRPSFDDILVMLPNILPKDTNISEFNEYVNRVNPDAAKNIKVSILTNANLKKISPLISQEIDDNLTEKIEIPFQDGKLIKTSTNRSGTEYQLLNNSARMVTTIKTQAIMGNAKEMFNYGLLLYCGDEDVERNVTEAISYITKAAEKGNADATYWLGMHYFDGIDGFEIDMEKARSYIKSAADNNFPLAQFFYGFYCERGCEFYPPDVNPSKVKSAQKKKYEWKADKREGFIYTKMAAEKGHAVSAMITAKKYEKGIEPDDTSNFSLPRDNEQATKYYKIAADAGNTYSMVKLAERASIGLGMPKDPTFSVKYMKCAADNNDMHAMYYYGTYFLNGMNGCKQNNALGVEYIKKAADKGLPEARTLISCILETGLDGVEKNEELANKYKQNTPQVSPKK